MDYVKGSPYFKDVSGELPQYPYLSKSCNCDVLIVGGGVTGAITAYYFSKLGINVILVEQNRIAHCSTSVTTALLEYELDQTGAQLQQVESLEDVITSYKLGIDALNEIHTFIEEYGNKCEYQKRDTLLFSLEASDVALLKEEFDMRMKQGFPVKFLSNENHSFPFNLQGAVQSINGGAELNPVLFTHQLLDVAMQNGVKVYEHTAIEKLLYNDEGIKATAQYGVEIHAKKVVVATGYNIKKLTNRSLGEKSITYNIVTKPLSSLDQWTDRMLLRDVNNPYRYFRTTTDNRIMIGGEDIPMTEENFTENVALEKYNRLVNHLKAMFPQLPIEIEYAYCGAFATTENDLGFIGEDPEHSNLWYNLGYGANGILFAILGGKILSDLYQGNKSEYLQLFSLQR